MSTSTLTPRTQQRAARLTPPADQTLLARTRAAFGRLRGIFGPGYDFAWASSLQPEHLLAYATWSEIIADAEDDAPNVRANPESIEANR